MDRARNILLHFLKYSWILVLLVLVVALRDFDFGELARIIGGMNLPGLVGLLALNVIIHFLITSRWWLFVRTLDGRVPFLKLVRYRLTSFGITYFTPGPQVGGEPYQVLVLQRNHSVPIHTALSSVSLDKMIDLGANFSFLLIGLSVMILGGYLGAYPPTLAVWSLISLILLPVFYGIILRHGYLPLSSLIEALITNIRPLKKLDKVSRVVRETEPTIANFCRHHLGTLILAVILAVVTWGAMAFEFWLLLRLLGLELPIAQAVMVLSAARIAFLLPMPSGLGTLEASQVIAVQALGYGAGYGIGLSLMIRARDILFGGLGLILGGLVLPRLSNFGQFINNLGNPTTRRSAS